MSWFRRNATPRNVNTADATPAPPSTPAVPAAPVAPVAPVPPVAPQAPAATTPPPYPTTIVSTMMDFPLTLAHAFDRARRYHADREIVTVTQDGVERTTYGEVCRRSLLLAGALEHLGIHQGDR